MGHRGCIRVDGFPEQKHERQDTKQQNGGKMERIRERKEVGLAQQLLIDHAIGRELR